MTKYHLRVRNKKRKVMVVKKQAKPLLVDRLTYCAAIVEPLITLPQVYQIFHQKSATGVSLSSWVGFEILTLVWLWYGIVHKERVIVLYQGLFALFQVGIIVGGLMYGAKW